MAKRTAFTIRSSWQESVIARLHETAGHSNLTDEEKATLLIQVIDEAEQLLNPIQCRLAGEDKQMELLPQ